MKIVVNDKHLIYSTVIISIIIISIFGLKILGNFNPDFKEFYNREVNLITGKSVSTTCSDASTLFKVSSSTNAHASLITDTAYTFRACTGNLVISNRACNADGSNVIIKLSSSTNAHVEKPTQNSYNVKVCSSDLTCNYRSSCNSDEQCVVSISSDTNAHVGDCVGGYNLKLCCKASSCSIRSCELDVCNTKNTCQTSGCLWDNTNSKCCPPGKIYDAGLGKCIYDPNGITVILKVGEESKFVFNNELHKLKFTSFKDSSTTTVTVSSLPAFDLTARGTHDVNLNADTIDDFRVRLNNIIDSDPATGSASFTYIISDEGLCKDPNCLDSSCNYGFAYCTIGTTCNYYQPNKKYPDSACCKNGFRWNSVTKTCEDFQISGKCSTFGEFDANAETVCCQASSRTGFWFPIRIY